MTMSRRIGWIFGWAEVYRAAYADNKKRQKLNLQLRKIYAIFLSEESLPFPAVIPVKDFVQRFAVGIVIKC